MGVTLERVQNKFACIIGELCSEPLVLSQFAVWVDLRIAEYKTNGTISLDCSGDSPNPKWMKGVKNHPPRAGPNSMDTGQHPHFRQDSYSASPAASPSFDRESSQSSQPTYSRLSPDIVVVKEEQNFDEQSSCTLSRKRHSDGNDWQNDFYSPSKSRRLGNNSTTLSSAQESSSNQSLMSIINTETDTTALEQVDPSDTDIFQSPMGTTQSDFNTSQGSSSDFSSHLPSSSSPSQSTWSSQFNQSAQGSSSQGVTSMVKTRDSLNTLVRTKRSKSASCKTLAQTAKNSFLAWRAKANPEDQRNIENIPTDELDQYLCDFFMTAKRHDGRGYSSQSLFSLRSGFDSYLMDKHYPSSILGPLFEKSKSAFKEKQHRLAMQKLQAMSQSTETLSP